MTLFIATEPCEPPITNTNGCDESNPRRALACARAFFQSPLAPLSASATSLRSGKPVIKASLKAPVLTPCATAR